MQTTTAAPDAAALAEVAGTLGAPAGVLEPGPPERLGTGVDERAQVVERQAAGSGEAPDERFRVRVAQAGLQHGLAPLGRRLDRLQPPADRLDLGAARVPFEEIVDAVAALFPMPQASGHQHIGRALPRWDARHQRGQHLVGNQPVRQVLTAVANATEPEPRGDRPSLHDLRVRPHAVVDLEPGHYDRPRA